MLAPLFVVALALAGSLGQTATTLPPPLGAALRTERRVNLIDLPPGSHAFNGSIARYNGEIMMAFRLDLKPNQTWPEMQIGIVALTEDFVPTGKHEILETRLHPGVTVSTAEDPRLFVFEDDLYVCYNSTATGYMGSPRHVYLGRVDVTHDRDGRSHFEMAASRELLVDRPNGTRWMEKSWVPLSTKSGLFMVYEHNPPEVFEVPLEELPLEPWPQPIVLPRVESRERSQPTDAWSWGDIRGGTPTFSLPDGRLGTFFHSGTYLDSGFGWNKHYFMGFYALAAEAPFGIEQIAYMPLLPPSYYGQDNPKRIIFPSGIIDGGDVLHVSYGSNDDAIYVADIDKDALASMLIPATGR